MSLLTLEICQHAPPVASSFAWSSLLAPAVAGFITIIGWATVESFARARERRSAAKQMVDAFNDSIADLVETSRVFYALPGSVIEATTLATTIRVKLKTAFDLIDAMRRTGLRIEAEDELKRFRQAITGGSFDSSARVAGINEAVAVNIAATGQQLNRTIQLAYYESFVVKGVRAPSASVYKTPVRERLRGALHQLRG